MTTTDQTQGEAHFWMIGQCLNVSSSVYLTPFLILAVLKLKTKVQLIDLPQHEDLAKMNKRIPTNASRPKTDSSQNTFAPNNAGCILVAFSFFPVMGLPQLVFPKDSFIYAFSVWAGNDLSGYAFQGYMCS